MRRQNQLFWKGKKKSGKFKLIFLCPERNASCDAINSCWVIPDFPAHLEWRIDFSLKVAIYFGDHHSHWLQTDNMKGVTGKKNPIRKQASSQVFKAERNLLHACSTTLGFSSHKQSWIDDMYQIIPSSKTMCRNQCFYTLNWNLRQKMILERCLSTQNKTIRDARHNHSDLVYTPLPNWKQICHDGEHVIKALR